MLSKYTLSSFLVFTSLLTALLSLTPSNSYAAATESITLTLDMKAYRLAEQGDGTTLITASGFNQFGAPGNPLLPGKSVHVALPPDVDISSVQISVIPLESELAQGQHAFVAAGPMVAWVDGRELVDWGVNGATIRDGRNSAVFDHNAWFPQDLTELQDTSQMRKWLFARLWFSPVQINPQTGQVRINTAVKVEIQFQRRRALDNRMNQALHDHAFDRQASTQFVNYAQARSWYGISEGHLAADQQPGLAIITTNQIAAGSARLADFVAHKERLGFHVTVVSEDDYAGLSGQAPNGTAEKIRQWLIEHFLVDNITYVMLIGDPSPMGDVPMKLCWARYSSDEYRSVPTDYFYADLTGNWNLDGDGQFCEYQEDGGAGGVDFTADVFVGRIPVYVGRSGWQSTLDSILYKMVFYDKERNVSWRNSALLTMAFSDPQTDNAFVGEHMRQDFLARNQIKATTLYQQSAGSECDSIFASDQRLTHRRAGEMWHNPYGLVTWKGHGSSRQVVLNCGEGVLFDQYDVPGLDDTHPAFVFLGSCRNGYPEDNLNLGTQLLRHGAIGTLSASRVAFYSRGTWHRNSEPDHATIGYLFLEGLAGAKRAGEALYRPSISIVAEGSSWWHNLFAFNYYGDPTSQMLRQPQMALDRESVSMVLGPGSAATRIIEVSNSGAGPLHFQITESEPDYRVAIYDHAATWDISYWEGDNTNLWGYYQELLNQDTEQRFVTDIIADLDSATLSGYNRLLLPDNGIPDNDLAAVAEWFRPGKQIIVVDDAVSYAAYAGWLWPDHAGSAGRDILWDPWSSWHQVITARHKITEDYLPENNIAATARNARLVKSTLAADVQVLAVDAENRQMVTVAARDVPGRGTIVFLGPFEVPYYWYQTDQQARLIRDAVEGGRDIPWLDVEPLSGTIEPGAFRQVTVSVQTSDAGAFEGMSAVGALSFSGNGRQIMPLRLPVHVELTRYQFSLSASSTVQKADPGQKVSHTLTITNEGNVPDSFSISAAGLWLVETAVTAGPIKPGGKITVDVLVTVPPGALAGKGDITRVVVASRGDSTMSQTADLMSAANAVYDVRAAPAEAQISGAPGESATAQLRVANMGNISDTYELAVVSAWPVQGQESIGPLAPGEETAVDLLMTIPHSALDGASDSVILTVTSSGDPGLSAAANWRCSARWPRTFLPLIVH